MCMFSCECLGTGKESSTGRGERVAMDMTGLSKLTSTKVDVPTIVKESMVNNVVSNTESRYVERS